MKRIIAAGALALMLANTALASDWVQLGSARSSVGQYTYFVDSTSIRWISAYRVKAWLRYNLANDQTLPGESRLFRSMKSLKVFDCANHSAALESTAFFDINGLYITDHTYPSLTFEPTIPDTVDDITLQKLCKTKPRPRPHHHYRPI